MLAHSLSLIFVAFVVGCLLNYKLSMKFDLQRIAVPAMLSMMVPLTTVTPALAVIGDAAAGKAIFEVKCAACHAGGGNVISPSKGLTNAALEANKLVTDEALAGLVANGKGQMPMYGPKAPPFGRLTDEQIADVVQYVRDQAASGWSSS